MKLSVSLPEADVELLDELAQAHGYGSRSAVLQQAVRLLRAAETSAAYESAWEEWAENDDAEDWDKLAGDGLQR